MKQKVAMKRKRKDRTWAEAATLAIQMSSKKVLGIRPILQAIYEKKLKEISMNKAAENVLTTMLNHHAQLPNCPFFRVKGRYGLYALKESWLKKNSNTDAELSEISELGTADIAACEDKVPRPNDVLTRENHTFSIQGRALSPDVQLGNLDKPVSATNFRRKHGIADSGDCASVGCSRRHSSPITNRTNSIPRQVSRHRMIVSRVNSWSTRSSSPCYDYDDDSSPKLDSTLDLETPSSILVNANMRALVNREMFALLPASYRYQLTGLLPECDRVVDSSKDDGHKVLEPSKTAFTNEFFTQAVQEWRERLSDGEFTRETQSRIAQEIAKERSKIDPWKEKFFEEFYGQKQVTHKRLRSRGTDGHEVRDFGMEAQLAKFAHLKPELQENDTKENLDSFTPEISDDDENYKLPPPRRQSGQSAVSNLYLRTFTNPYKKSRNSYAERIARTKLANSRLSKLRSYKTSPGASDLAKARLQKPAAKLSTPPTATSSIVMKPSGVLSALARRANQNCAAMSTRKNAIYDYDESNGSCEHGNKYLHVRKDKLGSAILDHSYTSTPWQRALEKDEVVHTTPQASPAPLSTVPSTRSSSTLVLCPRGNLVNSTIGNLTAQHGHFVGSNNRSINSSVTTTTSILSGFPKTDAWFKIIKPSNNSNNTDEERVLSIRARPLTPETFAGGTSKSANTFLTTIKRASPLLVESRLETSQESRLPSVKSTTTAAHVNANHPIRGGQPVRELTISRESSLHKVTCASLSVPSLTTLSGTSPRTLEVITASRVTRTTPDSHKTNRFTPSGLATCDTSSLQPCTASISPVVSSLSERNIATRHSPHGRRTSQVIANSPECSESVTSAHGVASPPDCKTSPALSPTTQRQALATSASPLVPGRLTITGMKRSQSVLQSHSSLPGPASKWGVPSSPSPPTKKTKTLAEIKALMKAKKAANAAAGPRQGLGSMQPGAVAANSHSHLFNATTFPVYFPLVTSSPSNMVVPVSTSQHLPTTATYIRLPNTGTLPLERVHWISPTSSQPNTTTVQTSTPQTSSQSSVNTTSAVNTKSATVPATAGEHQEYKSDNRKKGKITLKIKAAGSAISLKIDADVIKKGMKRNPSGQTSDEDRVSDDEESSSNESDSDDSDDAIRLPNSRISPDPKDCNHSGGRWSTAGPADNSALVGGDSGKFASTNATSQSSSISAPSALLMQQTRSSAVFGVPPYNVNVKPCTVSSDKSFSGSGLFPVQPKSSLSFRDPPTCGSWSTNMSVSAESNIYTSSSPKATSAISSNKSAKYKSISKGKSLKHMQELARTSMVHSDDSGDDNADSSDDDDDHGDSTISTTASENEKFTESDDSSHSWLPGQPPSPDSPLSDDVKAEKRPTQFTLKKEVKSRSAKSRLAVKLEPASAQK